jgi:hypothetical protein
MPWSRLPMPNLQTRTENFMPSPDGSHDVLMADALANCRCINYGTQEDAAESVDTRNCPVHGQFSDYTSHTTVFRELTKGGFDMGAPEGPDEPQWIKSERAHDIISFASDYGYGIYVSAQIAYNVSPKAINDLFVLHAKQGQAFADDNDDTEGKYGFWSVDGSRYWVWKVNHEGRMISVVPVEGEDVTVMMYEEEDGLV